MVPTDEIGRLRNTNSQLRKDLDSTRVELQALKRTTDATSNQLHQSELARNACEEYARKLEQVNETI